MSLEKDGYRLSLSPLKPQSDWTTEIRRVMQLLREAQSDRHPVSLVIDEFQKVAEIDPALPGLFKSLTDLELRGGREGRARAGRLAGVRPALRALARSRRCCRGRRRIGSIGGLP